MGREMVNKTKDIHTHLFLLCLFNVNIPQQVCQALKELTFRTVSGPHSRLLDPNSPSCEFSYWNSHYPDFHIYHCFDLWPFKFQNSSHFFPRQGSTADSGNFCPVLQGSVCLSEGDFEKCLLPLWSVSNNVKGTPTSIGSIKGGAISNQGHWTANSWVAFCCRSAPAWCTH